MIEPLTSKDITNMIQAIKENTNGLPFHIKLSKEQCEVIQQELSLPNNN